MTIDVNTATRESLVEYCKENGLKVPHNASKADLQQLVATQLGVTVEEGSGDLNKELGPDAQRAWANLRKQKKVKIRILENKDHPKRIFVGVNGVPFSIVQGAVVEVPESVVEVLRNAIHETITDEEYLKPDGTRDIRRVSHRAMIYPFEMLGLAA